MRKEQLNIYNQIQRNSRRSRSGIVQDSDESPESDRGSHREEKLKEEQKDKSDDTQDVTHQHHEELIRND